MKNANISRLGGFTLIELLVVVLIIGILAAMALPQYFKAVERSRMTEAVTLMDSIAKAQRRKFLQTNHYASRFEGLDVAPKGASGDSFFTKGFEGNGFQITISGEDFVDGNVQAHRTLHGFDAYPSMQYQYTLIRDYQSDNVICHGSNQAGRELCADFCGIDTPVEECCNDGTSEACPFPNDN